MTKTELQKELKEKLKLGVKPSHLKKSKSTNDLPTQIKDNLPKRKSLENLTVPKSLKVQLTEAQDEISILELKLETQQRELTELNNLAEENSHLKEQAKTKQQQMEQLTQRLEETNSKLALVQKELDNSLEARHKNLKDWKQEHQKAQALNSELDETIDQSSEEIINSDQQIIDLRSQVTKLQQQKQSLQKDLNLTQRLVELRQDSPFNPDNFNPSLTYLQYALYALFAVWFCLLLKRREE